MGTCFERPWGELGASRTQSLCWGQDRSEHLAALTLLPLPSDMCHPPEDKRSEGHSSRDSAPRLHKPGRPGHTRCSKNTSGGGDSEAGEQYGAERLEISPYG